MQDGPAQGSEAPGACPICTSGAGDRGAWARRVRDGELTMRLTPEGEPVAGQLSMPDEDDADVLMQALPEK